MFMFCVLGMRLELAVSFVHTFQFAAVDRVQRLDLVQLVLAVVALHVADGASGWFWGRDWGAHNRSVRPEPEKSAEAIWKMHDNRQMKPCRLPMSKQCGTFADSIHTLNFGLQVVVPEFTQQMITNPTVFVVES